MANDRENNALRILIIDDSREIAELLGTCLVAQEVLTESAISGAAGIDLAKSKPFDLALIDLGLPDMDGLDICQIFRSDKELKHIPIIIMTGRPGTEEKVRAFEMGVVDYLNKPFDYAEMQARVLAVMRRKRTQDTLAEASHRERQHTLQEMRRISKAVENASDAIFITDAAGMPVYNNVAFRELFGVNAKDLPVLGPPRGLFIRPDAWDTIWESCLAGDSWSGEVELRVPPQSAIPALCRANAIQDETGAFAGAVFIYTDITQRKRLERDLLYLANHDPLTRLDNRRRFGEFTGEAVEAARRGVVSYLLYLDLDNFKVINHSTGHPGGDRLLREIAGLLQVAARSGDRVARVGDDEFALLLTDMDARQTREFARKLVATLDEYRF
ncbi:MAG TPA: diguanylate cyclase, partial [Verrucomicrobiae bacterium]|nr:diguanylate cyclase [Verrucomicrobiae bacterium]